MTIESDAETAFQNWYQRASNSDGFPAKGTIAGALVVLERLKDNFDLNIDSHMAKGGAQIKGASGARVKDILNQHGETRRFVSEGGRTNRGLPSQMRDMLAAIKTAHLDNISPDSRTDILHRLQHFLVAKIQDWHNQQRMDIEYNPSKSTRYIIGKILDIAKSKGKSGQVAQYLVGTKLELRLRGSSIVVSNESYSTADSQLNREGDFLIGNTVFHVTMSPALPVFEKCKQNLFRGYRVFLLVPDNQVFGARSTAEATAPGQIAVESIESFVSQNIDEMSQFSEDNLKTEFLELLETYNNRVNSVEIDKSILIDIPPNLQP
ncbi:MAG: hypothetical protein OHK0022_42030 [Roseiflexaceae bacterium]